jgi:hypothetical protein
MERQNGKHIAGIRYRVRGFIRYFFRNDRERNLQAGSQNQLFSVETLHHQIHSPVQKNLKARNW